MRAIIGNERQLAVGSDLVRAFTHEDVAHDFHGRRINDGHFVRVFVEHQQRWRRSLRNGRDRLQYNNHNDGPRSPHGKRPPHYQVKLPS